jgi:ribosome maturation factor RimP
MEDQRKPDTLQVVGMAANPLLTDIWRVAEPLCLSEGMELVHMEFQREQTGRTLRLFLDKPGGVTLDDCARISRQLSDLLDVSLDEETPPYNLEVSSPGVPRPLGRLSDFERFKGRRAKIRTAQPIDGRKNFTGTIEDLDDSNIHLKSGDRIVGIAFTDIVKARLVDTDADLKIKGEGA